VHYGAQRPGCARTVWSPGAGELFNDDNPLGGEGIDRKHQCQERNYRVNPHNTSLDVLFHPFKKQMAPGLIFWHSITRLFE